MILSNNIPVDITAGDHVFSVLISSGTVSFEFSIDNLAFNPIEDALYSADASGVLSLPSCKLKALITGSADVALRIQKLNV